MDVAYDRITEETLDPKVANSSKDAAESSSTQPPGQTLNTEFQEAFKAVGASPWGAKLGGWFSQARKQGETFYQDLQKEATEASEQAAKGFTSLREQVVNRTRGMSLNAEPGPEVQIPGEEAVPALNRAERETESVKEAATEGGAEKDSSDKAQPESLPADIVKEAGSLVASLRSLGAAKLKDLQKAEDAADEALLKFGTNVRNFLRDAVTITAPEDGKGQNSEVLFETQEPGTGKKIFHTTRQDAQLHAIHTTPSSFIDDPQGDEWKVWQESFDIDKQTDSIAKDLDKYEGLRRAMEKLVPEKVEYKVFWMRYYFVVRAIEEEEKRRKEVLRGAAAPSEEEVNWDDDDDEEEDRSATPSNKTNARKLTSESTTTLNAPAANTYLKPNEPRKSEDENKSVAGSDASYDVVSGTTSRATGSPKERKKDDDSDDDWE